jgi:hypothetical protein
MRRRKRTIRTAQRGPCQTAYVKRYRAPSNFTFPENFDLLHHNLLLSESIRGEQHTAILLYWISEERARAQEPVVEKALGLSHAESVGEVIEVLTPITPKWIENPVKWGKWVISAAALIGAMSILQDHFTELFASPDVVVFAGNTATGNVHIGDPLDIPMVIRNQSPLGQADVRLQDVRLLSMDTKASAHELGFDISQIPQLQAGQNADVHIIGVSPSSHITKPTSFLLEVQAAGKEGFFRRWRQAVSRPVKVTFWPDRSFETRIVQISPSVASIEITLHVGVAVANGLRGQLTFASAVPPETGGIVLMPNATTTGAPIVITVPTGSLAKLQFQTSALQPFHSYTYAISVAFQRDLTQQEWSSLGSSTKAIFA